MILIAIAIILLCTCSRTNPILNKRTSIPPHPNLPIHKLTDAPPSPALLLAGCSSSSPLIPDIFLLSLYYDSYEPTPDTAQVDYNVYSAISNIAGDARLATRVGYFGICISADGGSWLCSNNATSLANEVSVDQDPLNLIWLASEFKDMVVFPYLMYVFRTSPCCCRLWPIKGVQRRGKEKKGKQEAD